MEGKEVIVNCNDCKQPRKAIRKWNYKFKEFMLQFKYCWGCHDKQYINGFKKF
mgnify:CR=1